MARELHVTKDKVEELVKNLVAKDLVTDDNRYRDFYWKWQRTLQKGGKTSCRNPDQTITQMLSKDETMGLVNVSKKMLEKEEN